MSTHAHAPGPTCTLCVFVCVFGGVWGGKGPKGGCINRRSRARAYTHTCEHNTYGVSGGGAAGAGRAVSAGKYFQLSLRMLKRECARALIFEKRFPAGFAYRPLPPEKTRVQYVLTSGTSAGMLARVALAFFSRFLRVTSIGPMGKRLVNLSTLTCPSPWNIFKVAAQVS